MSSRVPFVPDPDLHDQPLARPTEAEATLAFWARMRAEAANRPPDPEPLPWAYAYRCSECGSHLVRAQYDPGPRACAEHPEAAAETSTQRDENALLLVCGQAAIVSMRFTPAQHVPHDADIALAQARVEHWGGPPSDMRPVSKLDRVLGKTSNEALIRGRYRGQP